MKFKRRTSGVKLDQRRSWRAQDGQWNDPAFLAELAANAPLKITVAEGDRKVQDIRIGGR